MADPDLIKPPGTQPPSAGGGGGMLTQKMAGLPAWAWMALATAAGAIFFIWRSKSKATDTSAGTNANSGDTAAAQGLSEQQYESLLALLRDIQGSVSVEPAEPNEPGEPKEPPTPPPAKTPTDPKPVPKSTNHRSVFATAYTKRNPKWSSTLSGIAQHEHTTVARLLKLNPGIKNPNIIHPGQRIIVN